MKKDLLAKIQSIVMPARMFIEQHVDLEVIKDIFNIDRQQVWNAYADIVNYVDKVKFHLKNIDFLIFTLSDTLNGVTVNTPSGHTVELQLKNQIETLKLLRRALEDIDNDLYRVVVYYEKAVVMIW